MQIKLTIDPYNKKIAFIYSVSTYSTDEFGDYNETLNTKHFVNKGDAILNIESIKNKMFDSDIERVDFHDLDGTIERVITTGGFVYELSQMPVNL